MAAPGTGSSVKPTTSSSLGSQWQGVRSSRSYGIDVIVSKQETGSDPSARRRAPLSVDDGLRASLDGGSGHAWVRSPRGEHFEVAERAVPVELQRAPPIPAEAREELPVIKDGELFLCARPDGDVAPAQVSGEGFYAYDTRYLSEIGLEVGAARPGGAVVCRGRRLGGGRLDQRPAVAGLG